MEVIHIDSCPVCSGTKLNKSIKCEDYLVTHEIFEIYNCSECNFSFTQDFPSENVIGKYYEASQYISHTDTKEGIINKLYHYARKVSLNSKIQLIKKHSVNKQDNSLLDIGCGTGHFLHTIQKEGWNVSGIEKSKSVREHTRKNFSLNVQDTNCINRINDKSKDVITLWHVLEHIESLNETMSQINRILKKNGTLFIALPNKQSADASFYKENWAAYDVPRHLWHFSPPDFEKFATKHKFKLVETKKMLFDPFYISMLSEKNKGSFLPSIKGLIRGGYFLIKSLTNKTKGSSIIYVLKKKDL